jgi:hypothetical protein
VNRGVNFSKLFNRFLGLGTLVPAMSLFFDILMLRAIGLYYRHFKSQFAWQWE